LVEGEIHRLCEVRAAALVLHSVDGAGDVRVRLDIGEPVDDVGGRRVLDDTDARPAGADVEHPGRVDEELLEVGPLGGKNARRGIDEKHQLVHRRAALCRRRSYSRRSWGCARLNENSTAHLERNVTGVA